MTSTQQSHLAGAGRRAMTGRLPPRRRLPSVRPRAVFVHDAIVLAAGPPAFGDRALRDLSGRIFPRVHRHLFTKFQLAGIFVHGPPVSSSLGRGGFGGV